MSEFMVEREKRSAVGILRVEGTVDAATSPTLETHAEAIVASGVRHLVVVLQQVVYMSSTGWGLLMGLVKQLRARNGSLVIVGMNPDVKRVYDLLGIKPLIKHYGSEQEALQLLQLADAR